MDIQTTVVIANIPANLKLVRLEVLAMEKKSNSETNETSVEFRQYFVCLDKNIVR